MSADKAAEISRAIEKVKDRDLFKHGDPTLYVDKDGKTYRTTERIVKSVEPPDHHIPTDDEVFPRRNGIPDYKFIREHFRRQGRLSESQIITIIKEAGSVFKNEPALLEVACPTVVVGDIHGQYYDLLKMFRLCPDPSKSNYLFLGDYVDRGDCSIEVLLLLYSMKLNFPKTFWMIRGNHESLRMTDYFTFRKECSVKYSEKVYKAALLSFAELPLGAVMNDQFLCVHAGISNQLSTVDQISKIDRHQINFPSKGLFCDLVWSDPSPNYDSEKDDSNPPFRFDKERNCSNYYSFRAVKRFLRRNRLLSVIRGHQAQDMGYRMYRKDGDSGFPTVITIFSAPNYCHTYLNKAAALIYDGKTFNIKQFLSAETQPYFLPDFMNVFEWSAPFVCEKVVDILMCMLNVCTKEELEAPATDISEHVVRGIKELKMEGKVSAGATTLVRATATATAATAQATPTNDDNDVSTRRKILNGARNRLKTRLLAIGRTSRMLNVLREEAEKVEGLRDAKDGKLPRGLLLDGREELHHYIKSFRDAKSEDLKNEGMPPSEDEVDKAEKDKQSKYKNYIESGSSDVESDDVIL